jgi:hypothetical protein
MTRGPVLASLILLNIAYVTDILVRTRCRLPLQTRNPPTRTPPATLHNQLPFTASVAKHEASTPHCIYTGDQC